MRLETHNERFSVNLWKKKKRPKPQRHSGSPLTHRQSLPHCCLWCGSKQWASYPQGCRVVVLGPSREPIRLRAPTSHALLSVVKWWRESQINQAPAPLFYWLFPQKQSWCIWPTEWKRDFSPALPGCFTNLAGWSTNTLSWAWEPQLALTSTAFFIPPLYTRSPQPPVCCDPSFPFELNFFLWDFI